MCGEVSLLPLPSIPGDRGWSRSPGTPDKAMFMKTGVVCWPMDERQRIINVVDGTVQDSRNRQNIKQKEFFPLTGLASLII